RTHVIGSAADGAELESTRHRGRDAMRIEIRLPDAEFALRVIAPAVRVAAARQSTSEAAVAGTEHGECQTARRRDRCGAVRHGAVADLASEVFAPAVGGSRSNEATGV